jgi:transcriptional regulator with XRE-family HTH domain
MDKNDYFGVNFLYLRVKNKYTQEQIAQQLGLTRTAISNWEKGISKPDVDTLLKIASYFNASVDDLLLNSNPQTIKPLPKFTSPAPTNLADLGIRLKNDEDDFTAVHQSLRARLDEFKKYIDELGQEYDKAQKRKG